MDATLWYFPGYERLPSSVTLRFSMFRSDLSNGEDRGTARFERFEPARSRKKQTSIANRDPPHARPQMWMRH